MVAKGKSCVGTEITSDPEKVIGSNDVEQSPSSDTSMLVNVSNSSVSDRREESPTSLSKTDTTLRELFSEPAHARAKAWVDEQDKFLRHDSS